MTLSKAKFEILTMKILDGYSMFEFLRIKSQSLFVDKSDVKDSAAGQSFRKYFWKMLLPFKNMNSCDLV